MCVCVVVVILLLLLLLLLFLLLLLLSSSSSSSSFAEFPWSALCKKLRALSKAIFPSCVCAGQRVASCASSLCEAVVLKLFLFLSVVVSHSRYRRG